MSVDCLETMLKRTFLCSFLYSQITRPIALDGIKRKIISRAYTTLESFEDDFEQMFENAKQYNAEGSDVYMDAEELQVRIFIIFG